MVYSFSTTPIIQVITYGLLEQTTNDELIAVALNGVVDTENNILHIQTHTDHYIYKPDGLFGIGWYKRNIKNGDDFFLGTGAAPIVALENLEIKNQDFWDAIIYSEETETENANVAEDVTDNIIKEGEEYAETKLQDSETKQPE